jgi:hypothetical protein
VGRFFVRFARYQHKLWVVVASFCQVEEQFEEVWTTSAVIAPVLELLAIVCDGKASLKRVKKRYVNLSMGLLRILTSGRPVDGDKGSSGQSPVHFRLGGAAPDEQARAAEWQEALNEHIEQNSRLIASLLELDRNVSVPLHEKYGAQRKSEREEIKETVKSVQGEIWDRDFGPSFDLSTSESDHDDAFFAHDGESLLNTQKDFFADQESVVQSMTPAAAVTLENIDGLQAGESGEDGQVLGWDPFADDETEDIKTRIVSGDDGKEEAFNPFDYESELLQEDPFSHKDSDDLPSLDQWNPFD